MFNHYRILLYGINHGCRKFYAESQRIKSTSNLAIFYQRNLHKFLRSARQTGEYVWVNYSKKIVKFVRYEVLAMKNDAQGPML